MIFCPPDSLWLRRWGRRRSPAGTISPAGSAPWGGECLWSRLSHACFGSNLQLWRKYGWKKRLFFLKPEFADKFCRISLRYFWILWSLKFHFGREKVGTHLFSDYAKKLWKIYEENLVIFGHLLVLAKGAGRPLTVTYWTSALHCLCVCSYHHVSENMKILQPSLTGLDMCWPCSVIVESKRTQAEWSNGLLAWFSNESLPDLSTPHLQNFPRRVIANKEGYKIS